MYMTCTEIVAIAMVHHSDMKKSVHKHSMGLTVAKKKKNVTVLVVSV